MCAMKSFKVPSELVYGWGSLTYLKGVKGKKAFIVTDNVVNSLGYAKKVVDYLKDAGFKKVEVFSEVEPDPSRGTVEKGVKLMMDFQPDWIVGLGGGSSIDAAKAMWVRVVYPDISWDKMLLPALAPPLRHKVKFISIATTSGTGTEVSCAAVITNRNVKPNVKHVVFGPELCPDISISDPELASAMPPSVTANTGMDVLTHATEAYTSVNSAELDKALAIHAIKLIFRSLRKAYADGRNQTAREDVHTASFLAGMSFYNAALGITHSLAHQLGSQYGVPHGLANSLMLPYVMQYNSLAIPELYAEIADALKIQYEDNRDAVKKLVTAYNQLQKDVGQPHTLKDAGVQEKTFLDRIEVTSHNALVDTNTPPNPRVPNEKEMRDIYMAAYYGNDLI